MAWKASYKYFEKRWLSFRSSQSRWGLLSLFISVSTFLISIGLSIYALNLVYIWGRAVMIFAFLTLSFGLVIGLSAIAVGILWIFKGSVDPTKKQLKIIVKNTHKIVEDVNNMAKELHNINKSIKTLSEKTGKQ